MNSIGQPERVTQSCVTALFRDELGYQSLGDRTHRGDHSPKEDYQVVEEKFRRSRTGKMEGYGLVVLPK